MGVLILSIIFGSIKTGYIETLESEIIDKVLVIGVFILLSLVLDLIWRLIKFYFGLGDIKLSPWDLISNDYAMIT